MNQQDTAKLLAMMRTIWTDGADADAASQVTAYGMALEDVSYQDALAAFRLCMKELTFFPKPVEILERLPVVQRLRRISSPDADLRYILRDVIGNAVALGLFDASSGRIRQPDAWPNPIMAEAVRQFGWGRILDADREWLPREWEKVWKQARDTVTKQYLAGELVLDERGMLPETVAEPEPLPEVSVMARAKTMAVS